MKHAVVELTCHRFNNKHGRQSSQPCANEADIGEAIAELVESQEQAQTSYEAAMAATQSTIKSIDNLENTEGIGGFFRSLTTKKEDIPAKKAAPPSEN